MAYKLEHLGNNIVKIAFIGFVDDNDAVEHAKDMDPYLESASLDNPLHFIIDTRQ